MNPERFKNLQERFISRTTQEVLLLQEHYAAARQGDAEAILALQHLAHRINGSSAMLGLSGISEQASQIEQILQHAEQRLSDEQWSMVALHLQQLSEALHCVGNDGVQH